MRRAVGILAVVVGIVLVALPVVYSMWDRTSKAEQILDRFEFLTLGDNPERYLAEAQVTRDGSTELVDRVLRPDGADSAALARARTTIPAARAFSVRYSKQLDAVDGKFQSVYDIPAAGLSLTSTPWLFLAAGLLFLVAGAAVLITRGPAPLVALAVLGAVTVVVPVALGAVSKSSDAEDVKDFASRGLTTRAATAAQRASSALDALVAELRAESSLPGRAALRRDYPAAAAFLEQWDTIGPRLERLADAVSASADDFAEVKKMPVRWPPLVLLAAGLLTTIGSGIALLRNNEPRAAS
jgi:hypothetical protein